MEIQTDDYATLQAIRRNEPYQTLEFQQPKEVVASTPRSFRSRSRVICAFRVILTTVVIAILIAVVISFTTTVKHADGGWSFWEDWGSCSVSCGIGMRSRNRTCTNPVPQGSGVHCPGSSLENTLCLPGSCANACQSQPCYYGNCRSNGDGFECLCFPGYSGLYCENDINDCASQPCLNGTCNDLPHGYSCSCLTGFSGRHCQADINECAAQPCVHGSCKNFVGGYNCICSTGYTGVNCESDINDCATQPCLNGTCNDLLNGYRCSCFTGFSGRHCQTVVTDCVDILRNNGNIPDGMYTVRTWKRLQLINVYCDMTTDGGGWTVFQNRFDGSVDFYRNFSEYERGFGNLTTEFWLGLRNIQELAIQGQTSLRIDLESANGTKAYETFENFYLSPGPAYTLHLGPTSGSSGISSRDRMHDHNGSDFSTYDHDADSHTESCAVIFRGGWWYYNCYTANLNGIYFTPGTINVESMAYHSFLPGTSLKTSKMMMRR